MDVEDVKKCPICGYHKEGSSNMVAYCGKGHSWYYCNIHQKRVVGEFNFDSYAYKNFHNTCFCESLKEKTKT
jgi:hypothetical protein